MSKRTALFPWFISLSNRPIQVRIENSIFGRKSKENDQSKQESRIKWILILLQYQKGMVAENFCFYYPSFVNIILKILSLDLNLIVKRKLILSLSKSILLKMHILVLIRHAVDLWWQNKFLTKNICKIRCGHVNKFILGALMRAVWFISFLIYNSKKRKCVSEIWLILSL